MWDSDPVQTGSVLHLCPITTKQSLYQIGSHGANRSRSAPEVWRGDDNIRSPQKLMSLLWNTTWGRRSCWFKSLRSGWLSGWIFWTEKEVEDLERRIKSPLTWILLPDQPGSEVEGRAVMEQFLFLSTSILHHSLKLRVSGVVIEII